MIHLHLINQQFIYLSNIDHINHQRRLGRLDQYGTYT